MLPIVWHKNITVSLCTLINRKFCKRISVLRGKITCEYTWLAVHWVPLITISRIIPHLTGSASSSLSESEEAAEAWDQMFRGATVIPFCKGLSNVIYDDCCRCYWPLFIRPYQRAVNQFFCISTHWTICHFARFVSWVVGMNELRCSLLQSRIPRRWGDQLGHKSSVFRPLSRPHGRCWEAWGVLSKEAIGRGTSKASNSGGWRVSLSK